MRQEQVDQSDGDGREVLEEETDHPVVLASALNETAHRVNFFTKSGDSVKQKNRCSVPYLILRCFNGKVDKVEGSTQQKQDNHVEDEPEQVETHPLSESPLSLAQGEILLLQVQLRNNRDGFSKSVQIRHCS